METQSEKIQKQIDAANTKLLESKKKLAEAIQKEKAEKYDLIINLFSDEKSKYRNAQINGEKAIDFINRKIDEKLEAIAAEKAAKKEAAKAAKEQKADSDKDESSEDKKSSENKSKAESNSSDVKSKKDATKDESVSTFSYESDKDTNKQVETKSNPNKKSHAFGGIAY